MGIIGFMLKGIMGFILMVSFLNVTIGSLWVLRVAINWFWDWDYVAWIKGEKDVHR